MVTLTPCSMPPDLESTWTELAWGANTGRYGCHIQRWSPKATGSCSRTQGALAVPLLLSKRILTSTLPLQHLPHSSHLKQLTISLPPCTVHGSWAIAMKSVAWLAFFLAWTHVPHQWYYSPLVVRGWPIHCHGTGPLVFNSLFVIWRFCEEIIPMFIGFSLDSKISILNSMSSFKSGLLGSWNCLCYCIGVVSWSEPTE